MQSLARGQKARLDALSPSLSGRAEVRCLAPGLTIDFSCFGVDEAGQLSDDRYFVFFNQPASPEGSLQLGAGQPNQSQSFDFDLSRLPKTIRRLVFTATIDGAGEARQLQGGHFALDLGGVEVARFEFSGSDFASEKAIIVAEVYWKDAWRVAAVGQGFSGGLSALLKHFGGQEVEEQAPASTSGAGAAPKVSLDKDRALQVKLEKEAPHLVSLSKTLAVSLDKSGLRDEVARVALVLDASGSMRKQYTRGKVQAVVDRIATLAMRFDDDGELEAWAYATRHQRLPTITPANVAGYVGRNTGGKEQIIDALGGRNNEPPVMREVLDFYRGSTSPALVVFINDGGVKEAAEIKSVLVEASHFPIFWQFVGLGGSTYGVLRQLDTMSGRQVDNASFFHLDDLDDLSEGELYDRLLQEFPAWLREARRLGIVR